VIPEKGLHRIDPGWVPVSRQRYAPTPEFQSDRALHRFHAHREIPGCRKI